MLVTVNSHSGSSETLSLPSGASMRVFDNYSMAGSSEVVRAVVVVHGSHRDAQGYYEQMLAAAKEAGVAGHTIVVAPWFETSEDSPSRGEARWTNQAWKVGGGARKPSGLSSFEVMDDIVATLGDRRRFPNLTHVTVTGHSAGGQFAQRYAAFGKAPSLLGWVSFNFAPMNPSSYVYFDPERPNHDGTGYSVPSGCAGYNDYKYGLDHRSGYVAGLSAPAALAQYLSRTVTIIIGGGVTFGGKGELDTSCAGNAEGESWLSRGQYFYNHIHAEHPDAPHDFVVVPAADHDAAQMFASPLTWPALFGAGS
jgi:poly(3-hydroxybutyrate) depolymerase